MSTVMAVAMAVVMFSAQRSFPLSLRGLREWVLGLSGLRLASALFALTGLVPELILLPIANSVFLLGAGMQMIGTQRFYGQLPGWGLFHATLLLPVGFMTVATRQLHMLLEQRSNRDPLTSVLNRRGFGEVHASASARARRSGMPIAVMSIDLDFFQGHQ